MNLSKLSRYLVASWLCFVVTIFNSGFGTIHFYVPLNIDSTYMQKAFGPSDAGSYLTAALDVIRFCHLLPEHYAIFNLWPPGMPALEALILNLTPNQNLFGVILGILLVLTWGSLLGYIAWELSKTAGVASGYIALALATSIGPIHDWILDFGFFMPKASAYSFLPLHVF